MPSHTLPLNDRPSQPLRLTDGEALELYEHGFRFSIFRPGREQCQLSMPFETVVDLVSKTITIRQPEGRS